MISELKNIKSNVLNGISYRLNYPLLKPECVSILVTHRCHLKCVMCKPPEHCVVNKENEMTFKQLKSVIDQLKKWGVKRVIFSGGEPMLRMNDILMLVKHASSLGLNTTIVTNGVLWNNKCVKEFFEAGLTNYTTSIDGSNAKTHDSIRRSNGCFEKAISTLKEFSSLKKETKNPHFSLNSTTVVMKQNFRELIDIYHMLKDIGVTNIMFQAVSGDYPHLMPKDGELREFEEIIEKLIELKKKDKIISNDESYFKLMPKYYDEKVNNKGKFKVGDCLAAYNNLIISPDGGVDLCGYGPFDVSLKNTSLKEVWFSKEFKETRKRVRKCNRQCMYLCYKKINWRNLFEVR